MMNATHAAAGSGDTLDAPKLAASCPEQVTTTAAGSASGNGVGSALCGDEEHISFANDIGKERYPCSVVWTPIPLITWIFPFVGHMGICNSDGIIHDFAGPFYIGQDALAFGDPVKYWRVADKIDKSLGGKKSVRLNPQQSRRLRKYDHAIESTMIYFRQTQSYNFFSNNCHSYVAYCLEGGDIGGAGTSWNMVKLAACLFIFGNYISFPRFLKAHLPSFILIGIAFWIWQATKSA